MAPLFSPPAQALSADQTDPITRRPKWLPDVPGARWHHLPAVVRLEDRILLQDVPVEWSAPATRGGESTGPNVVDLQPAPICPWRLPQVRGLAHEWKSETGYGRPSAIQTNPDLPPFVAWARDVAGLTVAKVADLVCGFDPGGEDRVKNLQRQGRRYLAQCGALPWAAYDNAMPPKDWPTDSDFAAAISVWIEEADERNAA